MNLEKEILRYLSSDIRRVLINIEKLKDIEEIRIFSERHIILYTGNGVYYVNKYSEFTKNAKNLFIPTYDSLEKTISLMCNNSIYSEIDSIKNGYLTLPCGHRVGIVGVAVMKNNEISYIKSVSCINIRVTKQIKGFADIIINDIYYDNHINNTLVISPPQCGKTTLLRNISYLFGSEEYAKKVGIVDERNEIASLVNGKVLNDIGLHSFVICGCKKTDGINMLIRAMSPDVIITDEIGNDDDILALKKALCSGVKIITSIHAGDYNEFLKSEYSKKIKDFFETFIVLSRKNGPGTIENVVKTR